MPFQPLDFPCEGPPAGGGGTGGRRGLDAYLKTTAGGPLVRSVRVRRTDGNGPELRCRWRLGKIVRPVRVRSRRGAPFAIDSVATARKSQARFHAAAAAGTTLRRPDGSVSLPSFVSRSGPIQQRADATLRQGEHPRRFASREASADQLHEDAAGRNREGAGVPTDRWMETPDGRCHGHGGGRSTEQCCSITVWRFASHAAAT